MSPPPTVVVSHETGEAQEEPAYEAEYPPIADAEKETRTVEQASSPHLVHTHLGPSIKC